MITVVVCSRNGPSFSDHRGNVAKTVGAAHEYVQIDNRENRLGLAAAYNEGVRRATGDIVAYAHEDVFFMRPGWGPALEALFGRDPSIGLVGVAGTQYLFAELPLWAIAGPPYIKGRVVHESRDGAEFLLTVFSHDTADAEVVAVDGLFFAVRRSLFPAIRFDEETFAGFHLYDLDICMQVRAAGKRCMVTSGILVKHFSRGNFGPEWKRWAGLFMAKYATALPASCAQGVPKIDPKNLKVGENFDLKGKMAQETIV